MLLPEPIVPKEKRSSATEATRYLWQADADPHGEKAAVILTSTTTADRSELPSWRGLDPRRRVRPVDPPRGGAAAARQAGRGPGRSGRSTSPPSSSGSAPLPRTIASPAPRRRGGGCDEPTTRPSTSSSPGRTPRSACWRCPSPGGCRCWPWCGSAPSRRGREADCLRPLGAVRLDPLPRARVDRCDRRAGALPAPEPSRRRPDRGRRPHLHRREHRAGHGPARIRLRASSATTRSGTAARCWPACATSPASVSWSSPPPEPAVRAPAVAVTQPSRAWTASMVSAWSARLSSR